MPSLCTLGDHSRWPVRQSWGSSSVCCTQWYDAGQLSRADGAGNYAADTLNKAQQCLSQAEGQYTTRKDFTRVTNLSRQSVQAASDARAIAMSRNPQPQRPH